MNTEEKAKAYDEALEKARKELQACGSTDCDAARQIFRFFPQLKESEDERIRKTLIEALKTSKTVGELKFIFPESTREECIAYLEKQGEQKVSVDDFKAKDWYVSKVDGKIHNIYYSVDKVKPKFKVGDKIIEKDFDECGRGTIIDIKDGKYIFDDGGFICIEEQGLWKLVEQKPAWSEEDERIRKFLVDYFTSYKIGNVATKLNGVRIDDILNYLEKQKDLDKIIVVSPEVWDNAISDAYENGKKEGEKQKEQNLNPSKSVGLEEQKPAQTEEEREYVKTLKGLVSDFLRDCGGGITDVEYYQDICDWLDGRHIEQKPKFYPGDVIKCISSGSLWVRCKDEDNIRSDGHTACIGGGFELASEEEAVQFFQELNENGYQWDCIKGRPMKKEQKPADNVSKEEYVKRFKSLCDAYEIKLPNREYDIYHLCDNLSKLSIDPGKQRPVEWNEKDEKVYDYLKSGFEYASKNPNFLDMKLSGASDATIQDYRNFIDKLKILRPQPKQEQNDYITPHKEFFKFIYDRLINVHKENPNVDYMRSFKERLNNLSFGEKQEWSEEDVKRLYSIGTQIGFLKGKYPESEFQKDIDWLHALAEKMGFHKCKMGEVVTEWKKEDIDDKMLSNPKQEWSKEDEKNLELVINCIYEFYPDPVMKYKLKDWLKSLRPSWKPSENQMSMLLAVVNDPNNAGSASCHLSLESLYNDLKKL